MDRPVLRRMLSATALPFDRPPGSLRPLWLRPLQVALVLASSALHGTEPAVAPEPPRLLTTLREIRELPPAAVAALPPVQVRGVVTRYTDYELFIQDGERAIFVWLRHPLEAPLALGDEVEVTGVVTTGQFLPIIREHGVVRVGQRPLPPPARPHFYELAAGRFDCRWVEVEGVVQVAAPDQTGGLALQLAFEGASLSAMVSAPAGAARLPLIGARVRLRGVAGGSKTLQRQFVEPVIWLEYSPETFTVLQPGPGDLFSVPLREIDSLLEYGSSLLPNDMARVRGVATWLSGSGVLFLRAGTHSLEVRLQDKAAAVAIGDEVEVVGFAEKGVVQPRLKSAVVRRIGVSPQPEPVPVALGDLLDQQREADLVRVEGNLREMYRRANGITWLVAEERGVFAVDWDAPAPLAETALPPLGSRVSVDGICTVDQLAAPNRFQVMTPVSFRLHLRSLEDLHVVTLPPWWTPRRMLTAIAVLGVSFVVALGWIWTLNRQVQSQTKVILRNAQREAMLEERHRIAREFHDTLEQQLAAATMMVDAVAKLLIDQPERARDGLDTARAMLRHSLDEAQRAVADLRNAEFFGRDLAALIEGAVRDLLRGSAVAVEFQLDDRHLEFDPLVKQHLLRIVQEAVTNALKHGAPSRIAVSMVATDENVELRISDDGRGFLVTSARPRGRGEFGLIGLRERAGKIRARLTIDSAPGKGTIVAVALPHPAFSAS